MTNYVNGSPPTGPLRPCVYEVWGREQKKISTPERVCYQPQGGAVICVEGDDYSLSQSNISEFTTKVVFNFYNYQGVSGCTPNVIRYYTNPLPSDFYQFVGYSMLGQGAYCQGATTLYFDYLDINDNQKSMIIPQATTGSTGITSGSLFDLSQAEYKIEIFKNNVKVHEYISTNPISAWLEPAREECQWTEWRYLRDWIVDDWYYHLYRVKLREVLWPVPFAIKCIWLYANFYPWVLGQVGVNYDDQFLEELCSDWGCEWPEFDLRCKTFKPPRPKPECNKKCPEGYYLDKKDCLCKRNPCPPGYYRDDDTGICKPMCKKTPCKENEYWDEKECKCKPKKKPKCPKCPESAKYQCQSDGYLCCYDECYNLIAQIPIPKDCI